MIIATGFGPLSFARAAPRALRQPADCLQVSAPGQSNTNDNVIGLQGGFWVGQTISLAKQLLPDTRAVYIIDGTPANDGDLELAVRHQWRERHSDLTLVYLRDLALDDLTARLEAIPPHSIVVFIRQAIRTPSQNLEPAEGLTRVLRDRRHRSSLCMKIPLVAA